MKVLSFSIERGLLKEGSSSRVRQASYGSSLDELHIVVSSFKGELGTEKVSIASNVFIYGTESRNKIGMLFDFLRIGKKILKKNGPVVEWTLTTQDPFELGFLGCILKFFTGVKLQIQVHIDFFSPYFKAESFRQRFQAFIASFVLRRADSIRVVSNKIKTYLIEKIGIDEKKITLRPIQIDIDSLEKAVPVFNLHERYARFDTILLVVARLVKQKNIPLAVQALNVLQKEFPATGLVIVGSGREEKVLKDLVLELSLADRVFFEPWNDKVATYMKTADIFLMPSNYEGWGMTVLEAAACKLPVIMTDVGCAGEFLRGGVDGLVVPVGELIPFTEAIRSLLEDENLSAHLAQNAYNRVRTMKEKTVS